VTVSLQWGVKRSLREYVADAPHGRIECDGAEHHGDVFVFPAVSSDGPIGVAEGAVRFAGAVRLFGHLGMPIQDIIEPRIEWVHDDVHLSVRRWSQRETRVAAWTLSDLTDEDPGVMGARATLTTKGAHLFGGRYPPGTPFDEISLTRHALVSTSATDTKDDDDDRHAHAAADQ
jgi:hypothetical protein